MQIFGAPNSTPGIDKRYATTEFLLGNLILRNFFFWSIFQYNRYLQVLQHSKLSVVLPATFGAPCFDNQKAAVYTKNGTHSNSTHRKKPNRNVPCTNDYSAFSLSYAEFDSKPLMASVNNSYYS